MTDKPKSTVSFSKSAASEPDGASERPRFVVYGAVALVLAAVSALVTALNLYGLKGWLFHSAVTANDKLKAADRKTVDQLHQQVNTTVNSQLIATSVVVVALLVAARSVWIGKYWARWVVLGLWVLSTLTGTFAGFTFVLSVGASEPLAFKIPVFLASAFFVAAVILCSLRPSLNYFARGRPARAAGAGPQRGLFGPRNSAGAASGRVARSAPAARASKRQAIHKIDDETYPSSDESAVRARAKQRAKSESIARGADLARARAKASKSRRRPGS